ncbi:MAG: serine/threonine protein kinase [Lachnospiraceae bacterium]|nr:serine/threonine protein kinase [Lachnospiraceae bacterium]
MLKTGQLVAGRYRILNLVGQGGQSRVYLAHDEYANRQWAVKELRRDVEHYDLIRRSLLAEIKLLRSLNHPCLPSIIDCIDEGDDGSILTVMNYIEGKTLSEILSGYGAQPQERVVKWALQLCDVLSYLHRQTPPIIYRDIKPGNIMLKPDGNITLIDFGTARQYRINDSDQSDVCTDADDTICLGTRGYAAPEQFGGHGQTDARTDIYCLGATLYHLLTGRSPAKAPYEIRPIREWNPALSAGLEEIITRCTMVDPSDRFSTCDELRYALMHHRERDKGFRSRTILKLSVFAAAAVVSVITGICAVGCAAEARELETLARWCDRTDSILCADDSREAWLSCRSNLMSLTENGLTEQDKAAVLKLYDELAKHIERNAAKLMNAGVPKEELLSTLEYIAERLEKDILMPDGRTGTDVMDSKKLRELSITLVRDLWAAEIALGENRNE